MPKLEIWKKLTQIKVKTFKPFQNSGKCAVTVSFRRKMAIGRFAVNLSDICVMTEHIQFVILWIFV